VPEVLSHLQNFFWNIFNRPQLADIIDILIIAFLIYQLLMLVRGTRASEVVKGLVVLLLICLLSNVLGLTALSWVLNIIVSNGAIALVILFQPELRRILEQLGRGTKIRHFVNDDGENDRIVSEITLCLTNLSRRRVGALIVFERQTGLKDIIETGTHLDSVISAPLLENIFEPNTPLHDGAVIIHDTRIIAGACILSLSDSNSITRDLGTRHRAAMGVSETTDALVLIVSEETGIISMAQDGKLTRHLDPPALQAVLRTMYQSKKPSVIEKAISWLEKRRKHEE